MTRSTPLELPQISLNGSGKAELVEQQLAVLGALRILSDAMAQATPNGRDYQHNPARYDYAKTAWIERRMLLLELRKEIEKHAEAIDALEGR